MRGALLAGGTASRFGGKPKGLQRVGGERIADRVIRTLQASTGKPPMVVANAPEAAEWFPALEIIGDTFRECGSLGGIHAAIAHDEEPVLVVAWDMPFVSEGLLAAVMGGLGDADACVPVGADPELLEPLCAAYTQRCLGAIAEALEDEDYRAAGFHDKVNVATIPPPSIAEIGDPELLFFNVNTPDELVQAEEWWREQHD